MTTPDALYLEVDEEIPSVIEKLKHQPTDEVVLVIPAGSALVASAVNVKLLKRAAEKAKKRLALVTTDPVGRHIASQVGVPVFVSVKDRRSIDPPRASAVPKTDADEVDLRPTVTDAPAGIAVHHYGEAISHSAPPPSKPEPPAGFSERVVADEPIDDDPSVDEPVAAVVAVPNEPDVPTLRLPIQPRGVSSTRPRTRRPWLALLGVPIVAGGLAAVWYFYPRATVALTVATEPYEAKPVITVDSSKQLVSDSKGATVAGEHPDATADASNEIKTTGTKDAGTKATGTVALRNALGQAVKLSSGTTLATASLTFATTADVTIPAATATVDGTGSVVVSPGTATVGAQAGAAGDASNVASGTSFTVRGVSDSVSSKVSASASGAFTGGTTKQVQVVAQADLDQVKHAAQAAATTAAKQKLAGTLAGKKQLDDASRSTVVSDELSAKVGDETDKVTDKATVKFEAIVFDEAAARDAIVHVITAGVPAGRMLVLTPTDPVVSTVSNVDWTAGTFTLTSDVKTTLAAAVDRDLILKSLTGKSISGAQAALASNPSIKHATFTFRPAWYKRLPNRPSAIQITFSQAGQ